MPVKTDTAPMRIAGTMRFSASHPALPGHFPGRPLVPGVLLLDAALALIAAANPGTAPAGLARVKFLAPIAPDQDVAVRCGASAAGRVPFSCLRDGVVVIEGTALFSASPR